MLNPGSGDSFGTSRCRLIAQGVWNAYQRGLQTESARMEEISLAFGRAGISPERPWRTRDPWISTMFASTEPAAVRDAALQAADRIGARLVRDAVRDGRRAAWLGDQMELVNNQWAAALKPTGPDLCAGTPGIAMFLARLHKFTGERLFRLTADAAFGHAVSRLESIPAEVRGSLWSGWAGISWALLDAGSALDNAEWTERGLELAGRVARLDQFRRRWMSRPAAPAC